MDDDTTELPIALRRTPRHAATRLHEGTSPSQRHPRQHAVSKASETPRRTQRVKSSESGSIIVRNMNPEPLTPPNTSRQRYRQSAIPTTKRRKSHRTPSSHTTTKHTVQSLGKDSYGTTPGCNEVRIFPLRAILDDRVKRRIRRNGLSEEMNNIYGERKEQAKKTVEEMQRLRAQVAAKELENDILREQSSLLQDTSRIQELEREISELRQGLRNDLHNIADDDWDMAAADGFTDGGSFSDMDDRFRDDTTLDVDISDSPPYQNEKPYMDTLAALTPPNTSPTKSGSPDTSPQFFPTPHCDVGVQATFEDAGPKPLEDELTRLRCELSSLRNALGTGEQLGSEGRAEIAARQNTNDIADVDPDIQLQTDIMIQTLAEKTAALANLNSLISTLGSPSSDAGVIVATLRDAFQSARQELEQIFPDDKSLPVTSEGTVVLNNLLQCLRDSAAQATNHETLLKDHRIREQHLREQLNDRVSAMDTMSLKLREKDNQIFRLEADMERSETVVDGYRKSLADKKYTVQKKDAELTDIKANLGSMVSVAADLQAQLAQAQVESEIEAAASRSAHDQELKTRDLKILELQKEIMALREALTEARDSISRLQNDNGRLQGDNDRDKKAARDTVAALRTQLLQSLQMSEAFLE